MDLLQNFQLKAQFPIWSENTQALWLFSVQPKVPQCQHTGQWTLTLTHLEPIGSSLPKFSSVTAHEQSFHVEQGLNLICPAQASPTPAFRLVKCTLSDVPFQPQLAPQHLNFLLSQKLQVYWGRATNLCHWAAMLSPLLSLHSGWIDNFIQIDYFGYQLNVCSQPTFRIITV